MYTVSGTGRAGGTVTRLMEQDAFDILGLPASFDLSEAQVRRAYLARIGSLHPDSGDPGAGESLVARLNAARDQLASGLARAEVLRTRLAPQGHRPAKDLPEGFLGEVLELREEAEKAVTEKDEAARQHWLRLALGRRAEFEARVAGIFRSTGGGRGGGALQELDREINAWRYIERLITRLEHPDDPQGAGGKG